GRRQRALRQFRQLSEVLRQNLDAEPSIEARVLFNEIDVGHAAPWRGIAATGLSNLPTPISRFIGRSREMDEVQQRLEMNRLVTLVGVGGCGKTRLALEVAR